MYPNINLENGESTTNRRDIIISLGIIAAISIIIFRNFIFTNAWPAGGDTFGWVSREYLFGQDFRWLKIWHPHSFGFVEGINSIDFFLMCINFLFGNGAASVKIFMASTFAVAGFSMYWFAYDYTHNNLAALAAALVYMLNQWIFTQFTEGHLGILFGYALAPIMFLFLTRALKTGKIRNLTIFASVLTICLTGFNSLSVVIYAFFLAMFIIIYLLTPQNNFQSRNRLKRVLKVVTISGTIFLALSAFFILPFFNNVRAPFYSSEFAYNIEEASTHSYTNMLDAFVLGSVEHWGYFSLLDVTSEMALQIVPISIILIIIFLMAYSTVFYKTDNHKIFFFIACLISIFLAKGPNPPYQSIFIWSWFNVPHFAVFRAASRFTMMTAFSHAFFISVLVKILTDHVSKKGNSKVNEFQIEIKVGETTKNTEVKTFSILGLATVFKKIKVFLRYSSILLLAIILLSGVFSCWFFLQNGLQVYDAPEKLMEPYNWIGNQPDNFKIITVTRSPSEWELSSDALTDFGSGGMLTNVGWGHDLGHDSAFIHEKPVLQDGGHNSKSRQLVSYLRFGVARKQLSNQLLELLGTFDYKYVVLPDYASENIKSYFLKQKGTNVVYNQSETIILENEFHNERIFGTSEYTLVIGGFKSFFSTLKIEGINLNQNTLIFADQLLNSSFSEEFNLEKSTAIVFDDTDLLDLVMFSSENMNVIPAEQYALPTSNYSAYWGKSNPWEDHGGLSIGTYTLTTKGKNRVSMPFEAPKDGNYEILVRVGFCNDRGKLAVHVDNVPITSLYPYSDVRTTLKWIKIGLLDLVEGHHEISFTNDGTGWNDIDAVAVVESSTLEKQTERIVNQIQDYSGRIIHILSGQHSFSNSIPQRWQLKNIPYQGYVLEGNSTIAPITSNITILREGQYCFAVRLAQKPNQGTPQLHLDNTSVDLRLINSTQEVQWYETEPVYLDANNHKIELEGSGTIAFDQLVVFSLEEEEQSVTVSNLQIHSTEFGFNVAPEANVFASSFEGDAFSKLKEDKAIDGNITTRWASNPQNKTMPQWLQLEWETPKELTGAQVFFEQAYAKDYLIQTWNGTTWIDQIKVTNNILFSRFHNFTEPVNSQKLRVYVTSAPEYDMISIWEFEAYTSPTVIKDLQTPQDGFYRVTVQLDCGPNYGALNITINNSRSNIQCYSANNETKLYEFEPIYLKSDLQTISISAVGKAELEELTFSINDEKNIGFLDDLFDPNQGPKVSYTQIDPCKYVAKIENSTEPFLLVFSESYHPLWKAYIDEKEVSPVQVYGIVNGFFVNKTGNFEVTIYFTGQEYANIGIQITLATIVIIAPILVIPSNKLEKCGKFIELKFRKKKQQTKSIQPKGGEFPSE